MTQMERGLQMGPMNVPPSPWPIGFGRKERKEKPQRLVPLFAFSEFSAAKENHFNEKYRPLATFCQPSVLAHLRLSLFPPHGTVLRDLWKSFP